MIKPARSKEIVVKVIEREAKVNGILIPSYKFDSAHNTDKLYRYQVCKVVDLNGNTDLGVSVGDEVVIRRWRAKSADEGLSILPTHMILARLEKC